MNGIKCPICQNNLHKINIVVSTCTNDKCKLWGSSIPNLVLEALAKTNQDLERTRKALNVAADSLKSAKKRFELINNSKFANLNNVLQIQSQCEVLKIDEALEQITALEQKD